MSINTLIKGGILKLGLFQRIFGFFNPVLKLKTCNEELNIKDIRNNFLYTQDNKIMCYIKIQPLNLYLLSNKEQEQIIKQLSSELSSETKEMKFFSIARPVDVGDLISSLQDMANNSLDQIQKALLKKHINETIRLTFTGEAVERQNFLIVWQNYNDYAEKDLLKRAMELVNKFASCSVKAEILEEQYIIQLCSGFTNMNFAFKEDSDYEDYMPMIR